MQSGDEKVSESEELTPIQKSLLPPKPSCLGCRTHFVLHQKLQLQNISVEFKNYNQIPLKQLKHQIIILKTITAFLNTKGGAIYLGVEDGKCEVVGNVVSRPKQQEFRSFVAETLLEIYPEVDKEDVKIFFIPILKRNGIFTGRYITKILVNQGKVDTFYTFAQKIRLITQKGSEGEEFEERISYIRLGPGGLEKVEGEKLYDTIYKKIKDPNEEVYVHEGCNPEQMQINSDIKILAFRIPREKQCQISNLLVKSIHTVGKIDYSEHFDENLNMMIVEFDSSVLTEVMRDKVESQQKRVMNEQDRIKYEGIDHQMFVFGPVETKEAMIKERKQKRINERNEEKRMRGEIADERKEKEQRGREEQNPKFSYQQVPGTHLQTKKSWYYVFTHISTNMSEELIDYLKSVLPGNPIIDYYVNSLGIKVNSQDDLDKIQEKVKRIKKNLAKYGHNYMIKFGRSTGHVHVYNYIEGDREKLKGSIFYLLSKFNKTIGFKNRQQDPEKTFIDIKVNQKDSPEVLDVLLMARELRRFKDKEIKMKFMLQCQ